MTTPEDQPNPDDHLEEFLPEVHQEFRLNRYLASCGIDSRRKCDQLIQDGLVQVNGHPCTDLSKKVSTQDFVKIDGKRILPKQLKTIIFNKPRGCVCTKNDELDRDTIYEFLPPTLRHLNHVGRLDQDSEGLIVLTNDGDLAQRLAHPSLKVEKEYLVTTNQAYDSDVLDAFLRGVFIGKGMPRAKAKSVKRLSPRRMLITLETGLKRQIRLMCKALNLNVVRLVRIRIGMIIDTGLESGRWAELSEDDIQMLQTNPKEQSKGHRSSPAKAKKIARRATPKSSRPTPKNKSYKRRK
jgi:23S rRNA pseudouridine2605 synthase